MSYTTSESICTPSPGDLYRRAAAAEVAEATEEARGLASGAASAAWDAYSGILEDTLKANAFTISGAEYRRRYGNAALHYLLNPNF